QLAQQSSQSVLGLVDELVSSATDVEGTRIVAYAPEKAGRDTLRELIDQIRAKASPVAILLGTVIDDKVALTAGISKDLVKRGVSASDCVKAAAKVVGGGGGGRVDLAEAGGRLPEKLDAALAEGADYYRSKLRASS
ncbi:MAG: DHHA1 domain-containing protein, partial [Planctomycetota bacterium]|nr:DHHA1 domain-containing protein [Planctomycetota bacterium]